MDAPSQPDALPLAEVLGAVAAALERGGPAMWAIGALSVVTVATILWKLADLARAGAFRGGARTRAAAERWQAGDAAGAAAMLRGARTARARLAAAAMAAAGDPTLDQAAAEAETARAARAILSEARTGLRLLDLVTTAAPLLGLLGTVLGMIEAFRALEESGARADAAALAGGIWEALLTTAAGMAVALPAAVALAWFEGVIEAMRHDMEDAATRILLRRGGA
ncbi:MAG: MotA/TolQ/ExbB proton channel family protein [Gemmobacter sp.]|jgi:biopolymer transport protein ExbB